MPATGITRRIPSNIPPQPTAGTAQSTIVAELKTPGTLTEAALVAAAAVAFNGTNYRTFTLYNRGSAGAGNTVMATLDTSAVSLADNDEKLMTLSGTPANLVVAVDDVLELVETIAGTGVAHGGFRMEVAIAVATP